MILKLESIQRLQAAKLGSKVHLRRNDSTTWCGLGVTNVWLFVGGPATDKHVCKKCTESAKCWGYK